MLTVPVISSHVLQGLPAFVRDELGEKALRRANQAAAVDLEGIEGRNCFIPQQAMVSFAHAIGREAGEQNLGLLIAPTMDVSAYGTFGAYVFGGDTLGQAIDRSIAALGYHSTGDRLSVTAFADEVRFSYRFALAGAEGHNIVACAAAGELLSLFRAYLPGNWRPLRVELDIEAPRHLSPFEDAFQCPVLFGAPAVALVAERRHLAARSKRPPPSMVTIEDVARDRPGGAPRRLLDIVVEQIRTQVVAGGVMIDDVARSMDTSTRSLQRELHQAGTDFRSLTSVVRIQRASELLRHTNGSITRVSAQLGYSSPSGFARAFRKVTGAGPDEYRRRYRSFNAERD